MTPNWITNFIDSARAFMRFPPIILDGAIVVILSMLVWWNTQLGLDEAAKFIEPFVLWKLKICVGISAQGLLALKFFRSTGYAAYRDSKKSQDNTTEILKRQVENG